MKKTKKKPVIKTYLSDMLPVVMWVVIGDAKESETMLNKRFQCYSHEDYKFAIDDTFSYALEYDDIYEPKTNYKGALVWFPNTPTPAQAAHEAIHVLHELMLNIGLEWDATRGASNEHIAYLTEWIVDNIMKTTKQKKNGK